MANEQTVVAVTNAVAIVLPSVISLIKTLAAKQDPSAPPPTDAEVKAILASKVASSLAVDDAWLGSHPT